MRGHGQSAINKAEDFSVLADDVVGLLDHLGIDRTHFVGLSIGGMIGQQLAVSHGDRLGAVILCDTTSAIPPENAPMFLQRAATAREQGMQPLVEPTIERWFTEGFLAEHPDQVRPVADMVAGTPVEGYAHGCETIAKLNMTAKLPSVTTPTLVIVGAEDPGTPVAASQVIHAAIPGSELYVIDDASHFCNWQQPAVFNAAVTRFLSKH
jgi:3-oxoadipate enol-lactonase